VRALKITLPLVGAIVCGALFVSPGNAGNSFDGAWSVKIVSNPGCTSAYDVSIRIEDGSIKYDSFILRAIGSGNVNVRGRLTAQIGEARVFGRLARLTGAGQWHSPKCTGTWKASRATL